MSSTLAVARDCCFVLFLYVGLADSSVGKNGSTVARTTFRQQFQVTSQALFSTAPPSSKVRRPKQSAPLVRIDKLPLHTLGRYIVNRDHERVKWSCINWAGAYTTTHVVGGLQAQPLQQISRLISELGFNCVRLPYSTQGFVQNPIVDESYLVANPDLRGMRFLDVFDRVVQSLTDEGLMVIINNHLSASGWCCNPDQLDGFWYVPGYSEVDWLNSLVYFARKYKSNPLVVGFDLRNELHDNPQGRVTWGDGNPKTDWALAAQRAGNAVLHANPDVLIVVSAMCFCLDLRSLMYHQVELQIPNRIVYEVHNYPFSQVGTIFTTAVGGSWKDVEHVFIFFACVFLVIVLLFRKAWIWLGAPLPPRGALRMTVGYWTAFASFCTAFAFFLWAEARSLGGCDHYGLEAYMPWCRIFLWIGVVLVGVGVWGSCAHFAPIDYEDEQEDILTELFYTAVEQEMQDMYDASNDDLLRSVPKDAMPIKRRAQRVHTGWESTGHAWEWTTRRRAMYKGSRPSRQVLWDRGLCCGLQCCYLSLVLCITLAVLASCAYMGDSYAYLQWVFDWKWGFALQEGHPYTAPVWVGEFGGDARGRYWMHLLRYMSVRDVDFSFWALDGLKLVDGYFDVDHTGAYVKYPTSRWEDETYGMLNADYKTVRHPWKLLDVQQIMMSPAGWTADNYPCDRAVLGNACGG